MASKNRPAASDGRGVKIPIPPTHWWPVAARKAADDRAKRLGIRAPGIRSLTKELQSAGVATDEDTVGRCLRGDIITWDVAIPLSRILEIPPPAVLPSTMEERSPLRVATTSVLC